jgi:hypothetical protein
MPRANFGLHFIAYGEKRSIARCEGLDDIRESLPKSSGFYARARQYLAFKKCVDFRIDVKSRAFDTC